MSRSILHAATMWICCSQICTDSARCETSCPSGSAAPIRSGEPMWRLPLIGYYNISIGVRKGIGKLHASNRKYEEAGIVDS